jgi:phosphoglucosamine mutase
MSKYFGTDGFRGEANVDLNVIHAFKVGRFIGNYYGGEDKARIIIGKDTRLSSYMFEDALSAGLTASGADVYLLHVTPTPSVSYVVRSEGFNCGIMISASHNPYYDNGIKIINAAGHKLDAKVEEKIEQYIDSIEDTIPLATKEDIGKVTDYSVGRHRYIGYLMSLATRSFKDVKVGLDCANGSASSVAKGVFDALGARTFTIHNEPDGKNINANCGSTHIEVLQQYVKENKLDVGFAYDGDADRCLAVDDMGNVIDGDLILYLCGVYQKERGELNKNTVVTTIMSNLGLYKAFDKHGISYEKTTVGDKYVYENMDKNGYTLGGEQSGHIIFSKYAATGDGVLTSLMLMEVMLEKKQKLSELLKDIDIFPQLLVNVRVKDKPLARADVDIIAITEEITKKLGEDGRILLRESGTEPVIRVMVEAKTDQLCKKYVDQVVEILNEKGHAVS